MRLRLLVICMFLYVWSMGQVQMTVDRTTISIGDQVKATLELFSSMNGQWINKQTIWPDSMKGIEVVSGPDTTAPNTGGLEATWALSFFDTGYVKIPRLPVALRHNGKLDTFYTEEIPILVLSIEPDSSGLLAIKDIYEQPFSLLFYKRYIPHALIILLVVGAFWYWMRKGKQKQEVPVYVAPPPAPHEWAYAALDELAARRLWQGGDVKEHYSLLTGILRGYLERRFSIHALEQTSDEIIAQLKTLQLSNRTLQDTADLLSIADLIKFAKADPGIDLHAQAIERVRAFVKETTMDSMASTEPQITN
ncbi:MAG TPA: hypothetical protein VFV79_05335 [Saprospiraceae bacterium]|nr:hypothetical protein [Saprospiraceae bacterium]